MVGAQVGPFILLRRLGEGSMGEVYLAEHADQKTLHGVGLRADGAWCVVLDRIDGQDSRYQLGERLGAGGMAEVFLGTVTGVEGFTRRVAIKRVLAGLSQAPAFSAMFIREAQIASQLSHPNIVPVVDFSRDAEGRLFLVMEYVDGVDLSSLLGTGAIAPSLAIHIVIELLRGLGYAHELAGAVGSGGVIHRDVSPQNLLLGYEGAVKISDFGLAKARSAGAAAWSETVRGKPSYMSPEQIEGKLLDGRTDLYAAGVMLWEMLARCALFAGTTNEIVSQVLFRDIVTPSQVRPGVAADVEAVAMKLLARDRRDRYATAAEAIAALLRCREAPRDGRGELMRVLAERCPRSGAPGMRRHGIRCVAPGLAPRTVSAPRSRIVPAAGLIPAHPVAGRRTLRWRSRPLVIAAMVLGLASAAMRVHGDAEGHGATGDGCASAIAGSPAGWAPVSAADGMDGVDGMDGMDGMDGAARPAHRERIVCTGELAITVVPWALVWINGEPSDQPPLRRPRPAGRYRVRRVTDDRGRAQTARVTVEPDQTATIERAW